MHAITIDFLKRGMKFEKQGGVYGRIWKKERKGRDIAIIIQSQKETLKTTTVTKWQISPFNPTQKTVNN